ncbi:hypothetical protein K1719_005283 [Acacia pycnantha]|nr:hypothetical protein K1719_005283 [Acacia pycnantha]
MCVELDLTKPLIPEFNVEGQILSVVYESLGALYNKCGWFGHSRDVCAEFHRKKSEVGMEVELQEEGQKDSANNMGEKDLWKTVQRPRRQRKEAGPIQNLHNGSRFFVLEEETRHEEVLMRVDIVQEKAPSVVDLEKVHEEGLPRSQWKKGDHGNRGEAARGLSKQKSSNMGTTIKEGKSEKERGRHGHLATTEVLNNVEFVPKSNPELYIWKGVNMVDKENLHPRANSRPLCGNMNTGEPYSDLNQEDPIDSFDLSNEERRGTPSVYEVTGSTIFILEPRISGYLANKVIKSWGFEQSVKKEAEGFSGGIWILWNLDELVVDILQIKDQFIHCKLNLGGNTMLFTAIYANPNKQRRYSIWDMLYDISLEVNELWLLAGDFNEIKPPLEQQGGGRINATRCRIFNEWIQDCCLIDLEANGPYFTWKGFK